MKKPKNYWDNLVRDHSLYQMGPQSHRVFLLDLLQNMGIKSILDVGAGTGPIYELIEKTMIDHYDRHGHNDPSPRWVFNYKGTDYSQGMIESCKFNFPDGNWEVEDARHLKEEDSSWDCVLLMHSLDHLDDYQAAINEAARVAKRCVLIVLWRGINYGEGAENNLNDRSMLDRKPEDKPWADTHLQDYAWGPLKQAFDNAGLEVVLKKDDKEINKEGRYNTLILLERK